MGDKTPNFANGDPFKKILSLYPGKLSPESKAGLRKVVNTKCIIYIIYTMYINTLNA